MLKILTFYSILLNLLSTGSCCRWALYASSIQPIEPAKLWSESSHSLIRQSYLPPYLPNISEQLLYDVDKNFERNHKVNQDGWGFGWYETEAGEEAGEKNMQPRRYRSSNGATSNPLNTTDPELVAQIFQQSIFSRVLFAHIRASTDGVPSENNSHPFVFGRLLFMHNGGIHNKVALVDDLSNCSGLHQLVTGDTDTEWGGALFASFLHVQKKDNEEINVCHYQTDFSMAELRNAMKKTVARLSSDQSGGSSLNLAVSNGVYVIAIRYRTLINEEPPSLYYSFVNSSLWVASEPLDQEGGHEREWVLMAKDQMVTFDTSTNELSLECLTKACEDELEYRKSTVPMFLKDM